MVANDIDASVLRKMRDAFLHDMLFSLMHLKGDDTQFLHSITISHAQNPFHRQLPTPFFSFIQLVLSLGIFFVVVCIFWEDAASPHHV